MAELNTKKVINLKLSTTAGDLGALLICVYPSERYWGDSGSQALVRFFLKKVLKQLQQE